MISTIYNFLYMIVSVSGFYYNFTNQGYRYGISWFVLTFLIFTYFCTLILWTLLLCTLIWFHCYRAIGCDLAIDSNCKCGKWMDDNERKEISWPNFAPSPGQVSPPEKLKWTFQLKEKWKKHVFSLKTIIIWIIALLCIDAGSWNTCRRICGPTLGCLWRYRCRLSELHGQWLLDWL